ncbi:hypothetical protein NLG97_g954 [Lecanicillium saksenae]|uniref:Uncharacterized protein n=1 Tax=Lecanicillium saksenae TaxID=468837 RepID=A0ACC1R976_9HYPO|nr:hypothetical protein NLG97_g954 [Lecanicillium saksenae]
MATPRKYATVPPSAFPERDWTPGQVRAYITHVLVTKHELSPQEAKEIAEKWKIGRGWNFLEASSTMYANVFGDDVGPFLYQTVVNEEKVMWKKTRSAQAYYSTLCYSLLGFTFSTSTTATGFVALAMFFCQNDAMGPGSQNDGTAYGDERNSVADCGTAT